MRLNRKQFLELVGRGAAVSVASASFGCAATTGEETAAAPAGEESAAAKLPNVRQLIQGLSART